MQSEYLLPKEQSISICGELKTCGLLASPIPDDLDGEFVLDLMPGGTERNGPMLSFWAARPEEENRRIDFLWIAGQEVLAAQVEDIMHRHQGVVRYKPVVIRS